MSKLFGNLMESFELPEGQVELLCYEGSNGPVVLLDVGMVNLKISPASAQKLGEALASVGLAGVEMERRIAAQGGGKC